MRGLTVQILPCKPLQVSALVIRSDFYRCEMKSFRDARRGFCPSIVETRRHFDCVLKQTRSTGWSDKLSGVPPDWIWMSRSCILFLIKMILNVL